MHVLVNVRASLRLYLVHTTLSALNHACRTLSMVPGPDLDETWLLDSLKVVREQSDCQLCLLAKRESRFGGLKFGKISPTGEHSILLDLAL